MAIEQVSYMGRPGSPKILEAGGDGDVAEVEVHDPARWPLNLGSERDWQFVSDPKSRGPSAALVLPISVVSARC
jgi:choline dehydrogenase